MTAEMTMAKWALSSLLKLISILGIAISVLGPLPTTVSVALGGLSGALYTFTDMEQQKYGGVQ